MNLWDFDKLDEEGYTVFIPAIYKKYKLSVMEIGVLQILQLFSKNLKYSSVPHKVIANELGLSRTGVIKTIDSLRKKKVIKQLSYPQSCEVRHLFQKPGDVVRGQPTNVYKLSAISKYLKSYPKDFLVTQ